MRILVGMIFFVAINIRCQSADKRAEQSFLESKKVFEPLGKVRQLTCRLRVELPAPILSRKPELIIFQDEELLFTLSDRGCSVGSFAKSSKIEKNKEYLEYLSQLEKQLVFANCTLLRAFQLRSPFEGFDREDVRLRMKKNEQLEVQFIEGAGWFRVAQDRGQIMSSFPNGSYLVARYRRSEGQVPQVESIEVLKEDRRPLLLESFTFETRWSGIEIPTSYHVFSETDSERIDAQFRVHLRQCVARADSL